MRLRRATLCSAAIVAWGACASAEGYHVDGVHDAVSRGDLASAEAELSARIDRDADETHAALLRLELATVSLHQGDFREAAEVLSDADRRLEVVDIGEDEGAELLSWVASDALAPYETPPYEKAMVNVLGMAARLAAGDASGAMVEARRLEVLRRFFAADGADPGGVMRAGDLLSAFAHRLAGRPGAARAFERRLEGAPASLTPQPWAPWWWRQVATSEVLVVVARGRAPRKVARTISVAEAQRRAAGAHVSPQRGRVIVVDLAASAADLRPPTIAAGPHRVPGEALVDLAATAHRTYERAAPAIARKALARATTRRVVAGEPQRSRGREDLVSVARRAAAAMMANNDVPDTRHWSLLPAALFAARLRLPPGTHTVTVDLGDRVVQRELTVERGGYAVALFIEE